MKNNKLKRIALMMTFLIAAPCAMLAHDLFMIADAWLSKFNFASGLLSIGRISIG